ncbi:hypothetical protein ACFQ0M_27960 [Kitasatospora aburaviensis]
MSQMLALAVPLVLLVGWLVRARCGVVAVAGAAGSVSAAVTVVVWAAGRWPEEDRWPGAVGLAELASLLLLLVLTLRIESGRRSAAVAYTIGAAVALWPSRFDAISGPMSWLTLFGFGSTLALPAVLVGLYLRGWTTPGGARLRRRVALSDSNSPTICMTSWRTTSVAWWPRRRRGWSSPPPIRSGRRPCSSG